MSPQPRDASGEVLQGYRLESLLGRGGMGTVYKARHQRLSRQVAIKVLADELTADRDCVSRFLQEAKVVNSIRHTNIVDVTDFIETEEPRRVAYVMELLGGPSLASFLKSHTLTVNMAVGIARQIASALEAVHEVGVTHRDLKPDNIMFVEPPPPDLSEIPAIKVLDFGIAKQTAGESDHKTATGMVLGTPAYMAPEQIGGETVSSATDVYALAEIFYEMIAGQRAFVGNPRTILEMKVRGNVPELTLPSGTPGAAGIRSLVSACLAVEPKARPNLRAFGEALSQILDTPTVGGVTTLVAPKIPTSARPSAAPASAPTEARVRSRPTEEVDSIVTLSQMRGRPSGLVLLGITALLLAAGVALLAYTHGRSDEALVAHTAPEAEANAPSAIAPPDPQPAPEVALEPAPEVALEPAPEPAPEPTPTPAAASLEPTRARARKPSGATPKPSVQTKPVPVRKTELMPW